MEKKPKLILDQIKDDFGLHKEKILKCDYMETVMSTPWDCKLCDSEKCNSFFPSKDVFTTYPKHIKTAEKNIELKLEAGTECHQLPGRHRILSCGAEKEQTLKLTQRGALKVIKIPKGVHLFDGAYLNKKLWAEETELHYGFFKYHIFENIHGLEPGTRRYLINYGIEEGLSHVLGADVTWKDDFEDEVEPKTPLWVTSLDIDYNKNWMEDKAFREWLANAFDVTDNPEDIKIYKDEHNNWVIEYDTDSVLELSHLAILGKRKEGKHPDRQKGQFGEGITVGSMIFSRQGYPMKIEAIGNTYYPTIQYNEQVKDLLLHFYYQTNNKKRGTKITIIGLPDRVVEGVKNQFLYFRKDYKILYEDERVGQIIEFEGHDEVDKKHIAIRDILVNDERMLFSYNIYKKELQNRDRNIVSMSEVRGEVAALFQKTDDEEIIKKILENYDTEEGDAEDLNVSIAPDDEDLWRGLVQERYPGIDLVIGTDDIANRNCESMGYKALDWGYYGNNLLETLGYPMADAIPGSKGTPVVMDFEQLTLEEKENFRIAKENNRLIIRHHFNVKKPMAEMGKIKIVSTFEGCEEAKGRFIEGMYRESDEIIYLHRETLRTPIRATGVLIHEFVHKYKGYGDVCREFENILTDVAGYTGHQWAMTRQALNQLKEKDKCKLGKKENR